jgi:hypothetical protein
MCARPRPPLVSAVIPAFNAESSIDGALDSVFAQTYPHVEVIVVDDGSTDRTRDHVEAWGRRVRLLGQPNGGPAKARNAAITASRGEFVAFLDADDAWLPDKLARQAAYFDAYPQTGLLHTAVEPPTPASPAAGIPSPPRAAFCDVFHSRVEINTLTVMVPREVLTQVGLFDERREIHVEDWDLWLRIAARHPVGYLEWASAVRRPGGRMSGAMERTFDGQAAVIRKSIPLCGPACPLHATAPSACLEERWHRFFWERGYARLRGGDRRGAREAFRTALAHRPLDPLTHLQFASTFAPAAAIGLLRGIRRAVRGNHRTPTSPVALPPPHPVVVGASAPQRSAHADDEPPTSLVHDTWYRRVRHAAAERLHDADDVLSGRNGRRRILFQAASPMSFVIFRPVYERLRGDPRLEFWFTAVGSAWNPSRLYERVGIHANVLTARAATWMKVDACINTDFWDTTWLRRRTRRIHFFHGVAGKYGLDAPLDLAPIVAAYDRLLFPNRDRLERYVDAGLVSPDGPQAVLTGYPKVDRLVDGSIDVDGVRAKLGFSRSHPIVMYAPTWSPHSSLNTHGMAIVDGLASAGFQVIVKLHDRSYDHSVRGSGGIDWESRLAVYRDHARVRVVGDPDSTPFLAAADALVTDHSSVGFEFALLDRPLVVVECASLLAHAQVTRSKVIELRAAAEVVAGACEVVSAVARQLEAPCLHGAERRALGARYFHDPGGATARAVEVLYSVLGLEAPRPSVSQSAGVAAVASAVACNMTERTPAS